MFECLKVKLTWRVWLFESKCEIFLDMNCCHNFDKRPVLHNTSKHGILSILSRPFSLKLNVWRCLKVKCCYRHNVMINVMSAQCEVVVVVPIVTSLTFLKTIREELQLFSSKNRENHLDSAEQERDISSNLVCLSGPSLNHTVIVSMNVMLSSIVLCRLSSPDRNTKC